MVEAASVLPPAFSLVVSQIQLPIRHRRLAERCGAPPVEAVARASEVDLLPSVR